MTTISIYEFSKRSGIPYMTAKRMIKERGVQPTKQQAYTEGQRYKARKTRSADIRRDLQSVAYPLPYIMAKYNLGPSGLRYHLSRIDNERA